MEMEYHFFQNTLGLIFHFCRHLENQRPKLWGGVCNLEFFCVININEMVAIFQFFIMVDADIPFLLTLRKLEAQTLGGQ